MTGFPASHAVVSTSFNHQIIPAPGLDTCRSRSHPLRRALWHWESSHFCRDLTFIRGRHGTSPCWTQKIMLNMETRGGNSLFSSSPGMSQCKREWISTNIGFSEIYESYWCIAISYVLPYLYPISLSHVITMFSSISSVLSHVITMFSSSSSIFQWFLLMLPLVLLKSRSFAGRTRWSDVHQRCLPRPLRAPARGSERCTTRHPSDAQRDATGKPYENHRKMVV